MTHYAIYGYYGQGNTGDEAILAALIQGLRSSQLPHKIGVHTNNPTETRTLHNVNAYPSLKLDSARLIKGFVRADRADHIKSILHFLKSDVVIIGGGGLFFDSMQTNKWMLRYVKLIRVAKRLRKKVAIVGVSVGPLHLRQSREFIREAFLKADLISVRDLLSRDLLIACGLPENRVEVIPDLVFNLESASPERMSQILSAENLQHSQRKVVALMPCCYNQGLSGWHTQYVAFCERVVHELAADIWFIPMQRSAAHDDLHAINSIVARLSPSAAKASTTLSHAYHPSEVQGIIGKADFVFAERLHGTIMALNVGVPCMGISYMPKVTGVLELAHQRDRVIPMDDFLSGIYLNGCFARIKQEIKSTTNDSLGALQADASKNFKKISQLLTHSRRIDNK